MAASDASPSPDPALFGARLWRAGGIVHIDVRGLEPPQPLLAVLRLLERPDTGDQVVFLHDRDPLLLYPELAERDWASERLPSDEGEVRLRLFRRAGGPAPG